MHSTLAQQEASIILVVIVLIIIFSILIAYLFTEEKEDEKILTEKLERKPEYIDNRQIYIKNNRGERTGHYANGDYYFDNKQYKSTDLLDLYYEVAEISTHQNSSSSNYESNSTNENNLNTDSNNHHYSSHDYSSHDYLSHDD